MLSTWLTAVVMLTLTAWLRWSLSGFSTAETYLAHPPLPTFPHCPLWEEVTVCSPQRSVVILHLFEGGLSIWILLLQGDLSLLPGVFNYLFISTWTLGYLFQTSGYNPIYFILLLKLFQFCLVGAFSVVPCVPLTCSHWCGLFFSCSNPRISHFLKNSGSFCWMTVLKTKIWVLSVPIATGMSSLLGPLSCQSKECMCV